MTVLSEAAHAYATRKWPVFPLDVRGKQPIGRLAPHGLKDATCDDSKIGAWWQSVTEANIGIPTGIAFDVVDLDSEAAMERFLQRCREEGIDPHKYPRAKTGRGRHIAVAVTGFGNKTRLLPDLDFRGRGGYIVAPPSIHSSGEVYQWIVEPNGAVPPAPQWLLELLRGSDAETPAAPAKTQQPPATYIQAAVTAVLDELRGAVEGERNDSLNRAAFSLGQMVGAGWLSAHSAELDLSATARALGLEERETRATIRSGLLSGSKEPRAYESAALAGGKILHGRFQEPADASQQVEEGFDALIEPGPVWAAKAAEAVPVIIRGWIVQGGIAMLVSDPKAGKTWIALELVTSVVSGAPLLNQYPVEQPGRVLYIATEGAREGTLNRLRAIALGKGLEIERVLNGIDFIWRKGVRLDDQAFLDWLLAHAADYTLVIVDVLGEAWNGDENKASEVSQLMRRIRRVTDAGATIAILHHLAKQDATDVRSIWQRIRGSTAFFGAFDSGIGLERPHTATRTKVTFQHRDDAPPAPFTFSWPEELVTGSEPISLDWQPLESDLAEMQAYQAKILHLLQQREGLGANEVAAALGGRRKNVLGALRGLVAAGQVRAAESTFKDSRGRTQHRVSHSLVHGSSGTSGNLDGTVVPANGGGGSLFHPPSLNGKGRVGTDADADPGPGNPEPTRDTCPACGKVDYTPLGNGNRRCDCGQNYRV